MIAALAIALAAAATGVAPQQDRAYLQSLLNLAAVHYPLADASVSWTRFGELAEGDSTIFRVSVEAGAGLLHGACEERCADLDLLVRTTTGEFVRSDTRTTAEPSLHLASPRATEVDVTVRMVACETVTCGFAVAFYASVDQTDEPISPSGLPNPYEAEAVLEAGEYYQTTVVWIEQGSDVDITQTSSAFHPYAVAVGPNGQWVTAQIQEPDSISRVRVEDAEEGEWRILTASTYTSESGPYRLRVDITTPVAVETESHPVALAEARLEGAGALPSSASAPTSPFGTGEAPQRVRGVFVGISDYPGNSDLRFTSEDARLLHGVFAGQARRAEDLVLLVDEDATRERTRAEIRRLAGESGPDDLLVIFFSGHGVQIPRTRAPSPADPDALDEAIWLYDGPIFDDELSALIGPTGAGVTMVVLDACYSGGFAKDVIAQPGRLGFFSSEEHVTSSLATQYEAGGFLARFMVDGLSEAKADRSGDGRISVAEMTQYLHGRYRAEPDLRYQHLVVDLGSVAGESVLFERTDVISVAQAPH